MAVGLTESDWAITDLGQHEPLVSIHKLGTGTIESEGTRATGEYFAL